MLIDAVATGNAILFLGAGASYGALHPKNLKIPDGNQLRDQLADKFLGGDLKTKHLVEISQYCENEAGRIGFQRFIRDIFLDFGPAPFHRLIPTFKWHAIATTNFDLVVDKAYSECIQPLQDLIPFYKNNQDIEKESKKKLDPVQFLKLHGCISHFDDETAPLILTSEQYVRFKVNRSRLFSRLEDYAHEIPIIFCGYAIADPNIQSVLFDLFDDKIHRPTYFAVLPGITEVEARFWLKHRITPINATFEEFITELDKVIPEKNRALAKYLPQGGTSLTKFYVVTDGVEPSTIVEFLEQDVLHVRTTMPIEPQDAKSYYRGIDFGFGGIATELDVRRAATDTILLDVILAEERDRKTPFELFVISGAAGNGKTTVLKRVAWDAANDFDALVLYLREGGAIRPEQLAEIYSRTGRRIFLFADRAALRADEISACAYYCSSRNIKLSIVTAERDNEWNSRCDVLDRWVTASFPIRYLSEGEVLVLLDKLARHQALGLLAEMDHPARVRAFVDRAQRQLLVALHEATLGKRFEDIVTDEYDRIMPEEARFLYLDICTLHRFGVGVRAGLISRVSGIQFKDFEDRLFSPLENVIFSTFDKYVGDRLYRTRHPHVAEIVFENILQDQEKRFDQLIRITRGINLDYSVDREAFRQIIRGRQIANSFGTIELGRSFYKQIREIIGPDPYLHHQEGVYELAHKLGDLRRAEQCLEKAEELSPNDRTIQHSLANLYRQRALGEHNDLLRRELRQRALSRLSKLTNGTGSSHDANLRLHLLIDEFKDLLRSNDGRQLSALEERAVVDKMSGIEAELAALHRAFPNDEYTLVTEAEYRKSVNDNPRAVDALARAFGTNPRLEWIAVQLADLHTKNGNQDKAKEVLLKCTTENPMAKSAHFNLGLIYLESDEQREKVLALQHLRSGFSDGDTNYEAQFWYARELFLTRTPDEAEKIFSQLAARKIAPALKTSVRGKVLEANGTPRRFRGTVRRLEATYLFLQSDEFGRDVFAHANESSPDVWRKIAPRDNATFELGFTYKGPAAARIALE